MSGRSSTTPADCCHCSQTTKEGIECDQCGQWWCKQCINEEIPCLLTDELYAALDQLEEFHWNCPTCVPETTLHQLVDNGTFSKEDLDAFGCNRVILGLIKTNTNGTPSPPLNAQPTPPFNAHAAAFQPAAQDNANASTGPGAAGDTTSPPTQTPLDQTTIQMMMLKLMQTMTQQSQQQQEPKVSHSIVASLPKVQLPTFDGDMLQWSMFWESFQINVDSQPIPDRQKMDYLRQLVKGPAFNKIRGLGLDGDQYKDAIQILRNHYGNPMFQRRTQWDNLHSLPPVRDNLSNLERFNDDLRVAVLAMHQCGIDDAALNGYVFEVIKKLPPAVMMEMHRVRMMQDKSMDDISMDDLWQTTQDGASTGHQQNGNGSQRAKSGTNNGTRSRCISTSSTTQDGKQQIQQHQTFCQRKGHYSDECRTIKDVSARRRKLADEKRCYNCLGQGHNSKECRRNKECYYCRQPGHHSALCTSRSSDNSQRQSTQLVNQFKEVGATDDADYYANNNAVDQSDQTMQMQVHLNQNGQDDGIVMAAFPCQVINPETKKMVKLMVYADGGARRSCISKDAAAKLQLKSKQSVLLTVGRFNSMDEDKVPADVVQATLQGIDGFNLEITGYAVPKTAPPLRNGPINLPKAAWDKINASKPINRPPRKDISHPIDIMLGQDYYNTIFGPHVKATRIQHQLYVYHTKLGNILNGNSKVNQATTPTGHAFHSMTCAIQEDPIEQLWKLDTIGISGHDQQFSTKDADVLRKFNETITKKNNRYEVGFPWKQQPCNLASNFHVAKQQLHSTLKSLAANKANFNAYNNILQDQLKQGIIEKVEPRQCDGPLTHYIAHFPVIRSDKSTTKVRIVYDPSVPTKQDKKCLNDLIHAGPCTLNDLTGILLRFRMGSIVMVSDVEKAFLQVGLQLPDRDATRFLWLKDPNKPTTEDNVQVLRFARIPFGIIASPHLLGATVNFHLDQYDNALSAQLQRNIYVDNVIIRAADTEEAKSFYIEAKGMFRDAGMNLREWATNDKPSYQSIPVNDRASGNEMKVLGMQWNTVKDQIAVAGTAMPAAPQSKRQVLSAVAKWFDPLGLVSPITIRPRVLIQKLWKLDMAWDDSLPDEMHKEWTTCNKELERIPLLAFPRQAGATSSKRTMLIAFTDASQMAYATCVYLWQQLDNGYKCNLVFSKARVTPLKPAMTIPKLELTAVLIGVRALRFVRSQLDITIHGMALWTDSQIVLHWMKSTKDLVPYVMRRKEEILKNNDMTLHYVDTKSNPADLPSRGCTVSQLQQSNWFNGPDWLQQSPDTWPQWNWNIVMEVPPEVNRMSDGSDPEAGRKSDGSGPEVKRMSTGCAPEVDRKWTPTINQMATVIQPPTQPTGISNMQSPKRSLMSTLRTTAYVLRFINRLKKIASKNPRCTGRAVTTDEINNATQLWIKSLQESHFSEELQLVGRGKFNQLIKQLDLQLRNDQLCCGGRLENAFDNAFPVLLPKNHDFTMMAIMESHQNVFHYGVKATLAHLRKKYWVPHGHSQVRQLLRSCTICRRVQGNGFTAPRMAQLPLERVQRAPAFKFTGLDYLGPLHVKEHTEYVKKWVAVFTCFTTRAIHLEIVDDCSTEALTEAMLRFIGRRGTPAQILSDNATQFKKGANVFKAIFGKQCPDSAAEDMTNFFAKQGIQWKFIPERSPWVGGFYERLVGLVKRALKKVLWKSATNTTTLQTLLVQLEGILNTRPLTAPTADPAEPPLCPAHFIGPSTQLAVPPSNDDPNDPEYLPDPEMKKSLLRQWHTIDKKLNNFWKMWQSQYLQELREAHQIFHRSQHGSVDRLPVVGELCLIKESTPRATWKMVKVVNLIYGTDGEVRFVNVMLPTKRTTRRGIKDLLPLEAEFHIDNDPQLPPGENVENNSTEI